MASERELGIRITAEDEASPVIEDIAATVDDIGEEATVEVEAETKTAEKRIDRFAREIEDLTGDAKELRIEFRARTLETQIRSSLRAIERLEDPIEIEAETRNLERLQDELRDLQKLAQEKYEIEIDADPRRTARRAADDLDDLRNRGEGLQSALPAIRGFGDELGGTARNAGIAGQAVGDLGDFALIAGERFGAAGSRFTKVATQLGTALGAAGLAGAIGGIALQIGQTVIPAFLDWRNQTEDTKIAQEDLADAVRSTAQALAGQQFQQAVESFIDGNQELIQQAQSLGIGLDEVIANVFGLDNSLAGIGDRVSREVEGFQSFEDNLARTTRELAVQTDQFQVAQSVAEQYGVALQDASGQVVEVDVQQKGADEAEQDIRDVATEEYLAGVDAEADTSEANKQLNDFVAVRREIVIPVRLTGVTQASASIRALQQQVNAAGRSITQTQDRWDRLNGAS